MSGVVCCRISKHTRMGCLSRGDLEEWLQDMLSPMPTVREELAKIYYQVEALPTGRKFTHKIYLVGFTVS